MKELSALKVGHRYTFVKLSDFGFPYSALLELVEIKVEPYAQHAETTVLTFKLKGKRKLRHLRIFNRDEYLVYDGWVEVDTEMYVETLPSSDDTKVSRSLRSFDNEYLYRAMRSVAQKPLIEKIQERDE